jgi:uncharacterized oligopeptide transporter (OPT) family protein
LVGPALSHFLGGSISGSSRYNFIFYRVFLSPPIRKQVIIDEQLAFPSGTATAQLISVLHKLPPPDTSVRRRKGYSAVNTVDVDDEAPRASGEANETYLSETDSREREIVREEGWQALSWSFIASSVMTLTAYFFPVIFSIPLFGSYLAREWLWTFTPSLSYVGQGNQLLVCDAPQPYAVKKQVLLWGFQQH